MYEGVQCSKAASASLLGSLPVVVEVGHYITERDDASGLVVAVHHEEPVDVVVVELLQDGRNGLVAGGHHWRKALVALVVLVGHAEELLHRSLHGREHVGAQAALEVSGTDGADELAICVDHRQTRDRPLHHGLSCQGSLNVGRDSDHRSSPGLEPLRLAELCLRDGGELGQLVAEELHHLRPAHDGHDVALLVEHGHPLDMRLLCERFDEFLHAVTGLHWPPGVPSRHLCDVLNTCRVDEVLARL
mmetsp:Transcript_95048/g.132092  ORF Transcript_95048/g.132092 Transcript_95048/m.132092 type:complete len:246 (+) Transcript_95048:7-744(+)